MTGLEHKLNYVVKQHRETHFFSKSTFSVNVFKSYRDSLCTQFIVSVQTQRYFTCQCHRACYSRISETRKSITYNYMLYKGVAVSKINNHYSIIYLGLTN